MSDDQQRASAAVTDESASAVEGSGRPLAYVVRVTKVTSIPKCDNIEVATVRGWRVVVRRGSYSAGDLAVYFEIDSVLPQWQWFTEDNLAKSDYRIKTCKIRGVVSQGYVCPLSVIAEQHPDRNSFDCAGPVGSLVITFRDGGRPPIPLVVGTDLTRFLGVRQFVDPSPLSSESTSMLLAFPESLIPKTDQPRVQNLEEELVEYARLGLEFEVTEKVDGFSMSLLTPRPGVLWVCTRNRRLSLEFTGGEEDERIMRGLETGEALKKDPVLQVLMHLKRSGLIDAVLRHSREAADDDPTKLLGLQGEALGPKIAKNSYSFKEATFRVFDVYLAGPKRYATPEERHRIVGPMLGLPKPETLHVPVIQRGRKLGPQDTVDSLLEEAEGPSVANKAAKAVKREGLVFKSEAPGPDGQIVHFKAVSNSYLMKHGQ